MSSYKRQLFLILGLTYRYYLQTGRTQLLRHKQMLFVIIMLTMPTLGAFGTSVVQPFVCLFQKTAPAQTLFITFITLVGHQVVFAIWSYLQRHLLRYLPAHSFIQSLPISRHIFLVCDSFILTMTSIWLFLPITVAYYLTYQTHGFQLNSVLIGLYIILSSSTAQLITIRQCRFNLIVLSIATLLASMTIHRQQPMGWIATFVILVISALSFQYKFNFFKQINNRSLNPILNSLFKNCPSCLTRIRFNFLILIKYKSSSYPLTLKISILLISLIMVILFDRPQSSPLKEVIMILLVPLSLISTLSSMAYVTLNTFKKQYLLIEKTWPTNQFTENCCEVISVQSIGLIISLMLSVLIDYRFSSYGLTFFLSLFTVSLLGQINYCFYRYYAQYALTFSIGVMFTWLIGLALIFF